MANFTDSRHNPNGVFPENAIDGQEWSRTQPVITVDKLKQMYLLGVDLVAPVKNRVTNTFDRMTDETIQEHILDAIASLEIDFGVDIFPVQRSERTMFDRHLMEQFGYFRTQHKPVLSVDDLSIQANDTKIFTVPKEWINNGLFARGQINLWPVGPSTLLQSGGTATSTQSNSGALVMLAISQYIYHPQYFNITYTSGFAGGIVPRVINQAIGCRAAIDICNALAAMHQVSSYSLGIDGMNQSQSNPGPQRYQLKIAELEKRLDMIRGKIKAIFGSKWAMSTI